MNLKKALPRRAHVIITSGLVGLGVILVLLFARPLAKSSDGIYEVTNVHSRFGTNIFLRLPSLPESYLTEKMNQYGWTKLAETGLQISNPKGLWLFMVEYRRTDQVEEEPIYASANMVFPDGSTKRLIQGGNPTYGFRKRKYVWFILEGHQGLDPGSYSLEISYPDAEPLLVPLKL